MFPDKLVQIAFELIDFLIENVEDALLPEKEGDCAGVVNLEGRIGRSK